ncbi:MAG: hypothetical protein R2848_07345 [Thermomicrobiales bacterium]
MDHHSFDAIVRSFGTRRSRRSAVKGGVAAVAGLALGTGAAQAQGTPESGEGSTDNATLFVQTAAGGTFLPNASSSPEAGKHGTHLLTLSGHSGQTIHFSDRPQRNFGQVETETFLESMGFTPANSPNAALVVSTPAGEEDILILELLNPTYERDGNLLIYEANILGEYSGEGLGRRLTDNRISSWLPNLRDASLFIDDCPGDVTLMCLDADKHYWGELAGARDFCLIDDRCQPCDGGFDKTDRDCMDQFPDCTNNCYSAIQPF